MRTPALPPPRGLQVSLPCLPLASPLSRTETVPFRVIAWFTAFQTAYLLLVYGVTWAGVAG